MRALNDIIESNEKATRDAIPREQERGHYVLAKYTGVNFLGYDLHATVDAARAGAREFAELSPSNRTIVHFPVRVAA